MISYEMAIKCNFLLKSVFYLHAVNKIGKKILTKNDKINCKLKYILT